MEAPSGGGGAPPLPGGGDDDTPCAGAGRQPPQTLQQRRREQRRQRRHPSPRPASVDGAAAAAAAAAAACLSSRLATARIAAAAAAGVATLRGAAHPAAGLAAPLLGRALEVALGGGADDDPLRVAAAVDDVAADVASAVAQYVPDAAPAAAVATVAAGEEAAGGREGGAADLEVGGVKAPPPPPMPEAGPDGGGGQLAVALWFVRLRRLRNGDADADGGGGSSGDGGGGGGDGGGGGGRSMSTEDRLALLSVAIWVVAVAALAVALAFSAAEFAAAQRNPAVGVVIAPVADLRLPVVSFCSSTPGVPAFLGGGVGTAAAAGARGLPLLTLARVQHVQTGEVVGWPASGELIATAAHAGGADGGGDGDGSGGGGVGGGDGGGGCVAALGSLHMGALGRRAAAEWAAVTGSPAPAAAASTPEEDARSRCHACVAVGLRRPVVLRDPAPLVWGRGAAASAAGTRSRAAAAAAARGGSSRSAAAVAAAAAAARNPAYRVEVVESRALDYCTRIADGRSSLLLDGLVAEIAGAAAAFVDAGVLASAFPAAADAPALGFELADVVRAAASAERVLRRPSRAVSAADVADATAALNGARSFVCSVYFFSGVLYPVADAPDVAYRYEIRGGAWGWEPTGAGPYWVPPPVVTLSEVAAAAAAVASAAAAAVTATTPSPSAAPGSSAVVTGANEDSLTVYATDRSLVSAAGAAAALSTGGGGVGNATTAVTASAGVWLSPRDRMDILQPFSLTTYTLDKRVDDRDGARWAPSTTSAVDVTRVAANSWRHAWVELRVDAFVERLIERRPTTSVSEFLADVFELIGLFTGLCVYTVVVMPAQMVARNKRMAERAVARDLHTAVRRE